MSKLYTDCINQFLYDHTYTDNLTKVQTCHKLEVCSTTEQFLLNNDSIYEAKKLNGSLVLTYRDYKKACDLIFHKWLV